MTGRPRPQFRGLPITGPECCALALALDRKQLLDRLVAEGRSDQLIDQVDGVIEAIELAARQWQLEVRGAPQRQAALPQKLPTAEPRPVEQPTSTEMRGVSFTSVEAAGALGVSDSAVRRMARHGQLSAHRLGRSWAIDQVSVEAERQRRRARGEQTG